MFLMKKYGLGLQNPVSSVAEKYTSSLGAICNLICSFKGEKEFSTVDHIWAVKDQQRDGNKYQGDTNDAKLRGTISDQGAFKKRLFLCASHTSSWQSAQVLP